MDGKELEVLQKKAKEESMVVNPKHYDFFDETALKVIEKALLHAEYVGFLKGNALKYRLRAGKKTNAIEDIQKADYYEDLYARYIGENTPK